MGELQAIRERLRRFVAERNWERYHSPKNLAMALGVEAGELMALFRWMTTEESRRALRDPALREKLADEIADVAICLLELCDAAELDLGQTLTSKIEKNAAHYPANVARGRPERPA